MEFTKEVFNNTYNIADELWSEGQRTFERLSENDQEAVINAMDELYPEKESMDIGILNDLLWHEFNVVAPYCSDLLNEITRELTDLEEKVENLQDKLDNMEDELYDNFGDNFELYDSDEYSELEDEKLANESFLDELQGLLDNDNYEELAFRLNIW